MPTSKYNHVAIIESKQPSPTKAIYPGMIAQFNYKGEKVFDKHPLVLVLWNEYKGYKIHGINLNYLSNDKINNLFAGLVSGAKVYGKKSKNPFVLQDQVGENDYDDNLPYRNLLTKPYTRLKLPTYMEKRGGNPLSQSEAKRQMVMLYEKVLKKFMGRGEEYQVYRSYSYDNIKELRVCKVNLDRI
jgi:hypothetical protein